MTWIELLFSFIIGVASGIVSSVLVTLYYRKKDAERDRQTFFSDLRKYVGELLSIDLDNIDALIDYFPVHELPHIFPWINLSRDECAVIVELQETILVLQDVLMDYGNNFSDLLNQNLEQEDGTYVSQDKIKDALNEKYLPQIYAARIEILKISLKIMALGNKTLQETVKRAKKES